VALNIQHWYYPHEVITKFGKVYVACKIYVDERSETEHRAEYVTCMKCKHAAEEYEASENLV